MVAIDGPLVSPVASMQDEDSSLATTFTGSALFAASFGSEHGEDRTSIRVSIPFDRVVWNAQDCADYFKESRQEFLRTRRHKPGFPPELENCPLRWSAQAVTEWALRGANSAANSPGFTQRAA